MDHGETIEIPAGRFRMGSGALYPEAAPVREAEVDALAIDPRRVTVAWFARFIETIGSVTAADRPLDRADHPNAEPSLLVESSAVFQPAPGPVSLHDPRPLVGLGSPAPTGGTRGGPACDNSERQDHPVNHVALEDRDAFAKWPRGRVEESASEGHGHRRAYCSRPAYR